MDDTTPVLVCPTCGGRGSDAYCAVDGQRRVAATALDSGDPLIGALIAGRYAIESRIGQGGMGAVYLATQRLVERKVVVKVMHADGGGDEVVRARFLREARAASRVTHPNIITIFDFGYTDEGMAYLVMELIDGPSLSDVMARELRLPWRRAVRIVSQAARALDAAHRAGIVHRDVKPGNIMLVKNGAGEEAVKVLDFGVARVLDLGDARLTRTGAVMGTPAYMAPEQASGREVGPPADVYALGAMLFDMVTGELPFFGNSVTDVLMHHLGTPPPTMGSVAGDLDLPDALEALVASCLAKKPLARPETAAAVADELDRIAANAEVATPKTQDEGIAAWLAETGEASLPLRSPSNPPLPTVAGPAVIGPGDAIAVGPGPAGVRVSENAAQVVDDSPRRALQSSWGALVVLLVLAVAVAVVVLLVVRPGSNGGEDLATRADAADAIAIGAVSGDGGDDRGDDALAQSETLLEVLPPIPPPRGLRLDGIPLDDESPLQRTNP